MYQKSLIVSSFQSTSHLPDVYPLVNVQLKGHNFDILESYQSYVHNLAENMGIDVQDRYEIFFIN